MVVVEGLSGTLCGSIKAERGGKKNILHYKYGTNTCGLLSRLCTTRG